MPYYSKCRRIQELYSIPSYKPMSEDCENNFFYNYYYYALYVSDCIHSLIITNSKKNHI